MPLPMRTHATFIGAVLETQLTTSSIKVRLQGAVIEVSGLGGASALLPGQLILAHAICDADGVWQASHVQHLSGDQDVQVSAHTGNAQLQCNVNSSELVSFDTEKRLNVADSNETVTATKVTRAESPKTANGFMFQRKAGKPNDQVTTQSPKPASTFAFKHKDVKPKAGALPRSDSPNERALRANSEKHCAYNDVTGVVNKPKSTTNVLATTSSSHAGGEVQPKRGGFSKGPAPFADSQSMPPPMSITPSREQSEDSRHEKLKQWALDSALTGRLDDPILF